MLTYRFCLPVWIGKDTELNFFNEKLEHVEHSPDGNLTLFKNVSPNDTDVEDILKFSRTQLMAKIWEAEKRIHRILVNSSGVADARNNLFQYLNAVERDVYNVYSAGKFRNLHNIEKKQAKWCIRVLKNILRTENERVTKSSALSVLWKLATDEGHQLENISEAFLAEIYFLFLGMNGKLPIKRQKSPVTPENSENLTQGQIRSHFLDQYSHYINKFLQRYPDGLQQTIAEQTKDSRQKILDYFGAGLEQWHDYKWHLKHIIRDLATLDKIIELRDEERESLELAEKKRNLFSDHALLSEPFPREPRKP